MKCPKCGFNSFEFLAACKKCGADLGAFKQSHGISPVILRPSAVPAAAPAPDSVPETAPVEAGAKEQPESGFSWSAPEEPTAPGSGMKQDDTFDFNFSEPGEEKPVNDESFGGFSFEEQPEPAMPEPEPGSGAAFRDEFSFDDSPGEIPAAETAESDTAGAAGYGEDLLDPLSLSAEADQERENAVMNEFDLSSPEDVPTQEAASAAAAEDAMFSFEEIPLPEKHAEKKPAQGLDDFDKEFKEIFSFEETKEHDK